MKNGINSARSLILDANLYGELIFDVNSIYFYNHGDMGFLSDLMRMLTRLPSRS